MANTPIELTDFSGGIQEVRSPDDFDAGQWAQLTGFVLEGDGQARSQWALQQVGVTLVDGVEFQAVRGLTCSGGSYLVAVSTDGRVFWMAAPDRTGTHSEVLGAAWLQLSGAPVNPDFRILGEVPLPASGAGRANALLLHSQSGSVAAIAVYEGEAGLTFKSWTDFYPAAPVNADGVPTPAGNKMPRANIATVWGSRLVLGDISYQKDGTSKDQLAAGNVTRYPSSIWFSENTIDTYSPFSVLNIGSAETQLVGLHVLDDTLVAITSAATERDGCIVVRGDLGTLLDPTTSNVKKSVLRGGVGAPPRPSGQSGHYGYSCLWPETGAVVFLDRLGGVWHTEGTEVVRLDRFGPKKPALAKVGDHVAALGAYLFLARDNRLLCFRYLGELGDGTGTGSWTELITPVPGQVKSLAPLEDCMYFVGGDGLVWRYAMEGPSAETGSASERGCINGEKIDLTVSTATQTPPEDHTRALWFRFGMRLGDVFEGEVVSATVRSGPALPSPAGLGPGYTTTLGRSVAEAADFMVHGHGSSSEASATVVLRGDVMLESATFTISGKAAKRGRRGGDV